ncbi:unnamed protein product [Schistosoma bovis]|nr:unnamed protein product [Schistosoma bovis]CAH8489200.1 unnamed protein product [Schistosoma bovis]
MPNMIKSNHVNDFMNDRDLNHINYNGIHQTNGYTNKSNNSTGRYTILSKSTTIRNGTNKGSYHPASHYFQLDTTKRSHSQQSIGSNISNGSINSYNDTNNSSKNSTNGIHQLLSPSGDKLNGIHTNLIKYPDIQHTKSHSISSTLLLRDGNLLKPTSVYREQSRSVGGSLSCGQPSPTSTVEDNNTTVFSPTNTNTLDNQNNNRTIWLYQSELNLPTNSEDTSLDSIITPYKRSESQQITIIPEFDYRNRNHTTNNISYNPYVNKYNSVSSAMLYTGNNTNQRNITNEDYMNNYVSGPSFRKIQTLHNGNATQKRFPSDTTLNSTTREGAQIYTSGSRPGPVTIPARSRSAQPSPGPSPTISPVTCFRASENNLIPGSGGEKNSYTATSQKINLNVTNVQRRGSSPSRVEHNNVNSFSSDAPEEDNEAHILPSVREIIRQVEAMTQSNAATSTTDIFTLGLNNGTTGNHSIQKENNQQSQLSKQRKVNSTNDNQFARTGILRQCGSSQRTPSAPQLRTANYGNSQKYTPIQAKFNAAVASNSQNTTAPPVPPHGIARNKPIIGSFTRRIEPLTNDSNKQTDFTNVTSAPKKSELLSHLPTDYQKLREAFIEQRREIQRLRKQIAEKDLQIAQLEGDIRLYEPWR